MKINPIRSLFLSLSAVALLLSAGCSTPMNSYNQDYGQNLPIEPKYAVRNIDDSHFKIICHQGSPMTDNQRIIYMKEAVAAIARHEAQQRGWQKWEVDYTQQTNQGWMRVLVAIVTRENPAQYNNNP